MHATSSYSCLRTQEGWVVVAWWPAMLWSLALATIALH
jgi:hypothetical protein